MSLAAHRAPRAVVRFRRSMILGGMALLLLLILGGMLLPPLWHPQGSSAAATPSAESPLVLPAFVTHALPAGGVRSAQAAVVPEPAPAVIPPAPPPLRPLVLPPAPAAEPEPPRPSAGVGPPIRPVIPARASTDPGGPPQARKRWAVLVSPTEGTKPAVAPSETETEAALLAPAPPHRGAGYTGGHAETIIQPARWAIPVDPLRTIYRSQTLVGQLLQAIHSDIPGQVKMLLTIPLFDKFGQNVTILPKGTLVVAHQVGRPEYGNTRLHIAVDQLELPGGEVVLLTAMVGEEDGSAGLKAKVNNHYGKVLLATGISAVLNIGVRSAVGTPGAGQFFQNPIQDAAKDIGQSIQQETQRAVDRELRVPPTLQRAAETFCTINLAENVQFNRPPVVVR